MPPQIDCYIYPHRAVAKMHTKEIGKNLFIVDLETGGFKNLIASYILKGNKTIIVETGPTSSIPNLLSGLKELNVNPEDVAYIALTHVHVDHCGGTGTLLKSLPNAKVIVHSKGALHLQDPAKLWAATKEVLGSVAEMFGEPEPVPEDKLIVASEGATFDAGNDVKLKAVEAPGHASHNLSYYEYLNEAVFSGDSAGAYINEYDTVFPTTPPPFRPDIALISLDKLISLNPKILCYSHFGSTKDAVKRLRDYAVQIRLWLKITEEGVKKGASAEAIRETILREDERVREIVPTLKENPVHRKTLIENSVQGFVDFARKPKI
jgi:glyoxylase-like metal-dependent hydrolase (beta-lactamase superfamily II)